MQTNEKPTVWTAILLFLVGMGMGVLGTLLVLYQKPRKPLGIPARPRTQLDIQDGLSNATSTSHHRVIVSALMTKHRISGCFSSHS